MIHDPLNFKSILSLSRHQCQLTLLGCQYSPPASNSLATFAHSCSLSCQSLKLLACAESEGAATGCTGSTAAGAAGPCAGLAAGEAMIDSIVHHLTRTFQHAIATHSGYHVEIDLLTLFFIAFSCRDGLVLRLLRHVLVCHCKRKINLT